MLARSHESTWTRLPVSGAAGAVGAVVCAGVLLAFTLAMAVVIHAPEQPMTELSMKVAQPVDFDVLSQGANIADLERGRSYYVQLCLPCHGASGRGDGEWAFRMTPHPADLAGKRTMRRSDEQLLAAIGDGVAGTAMRGWDDRLSGAQLRQVLGYVRHLGLIESVRADAP